MKTKTTAALSLLACAILALPQASLAGKPDRNPSEKDCPNLELNTSCSAELDAAYALIEEKLAKNEVESTFLSRKNATKDAETLLCKTSGAEIKLAQDYKEDEAWYLMETAMQKLEDLFAQNKISWDGKEELRDAFQAAQDCISYP